MAYRANPFLERVTERTTSDQEFISLFAPNIIERLPDSIFESGVHMFVSPPGGGKTTLLRAFTPNALRAFWDARSIVDLKEAYQTLIAKGVLGEERGPLTHGVYLSCASGYADLPPGAQATNTGWFRALLNCRIVLRTIRSLATFLGIESLQDFEEVMVSYDNHEGQFHAIPSTHCAGELLSWAVQRERNVYAQLDAIEVNDMDSFPMDVRLEGIIWLKHVRFSYKDRHIPHRRLLMIDDLHKLQLTQRHLLIEELAELRVDIPMWLAIRSIAIGDELLAQGVREGRDIQQFNLEQMWSDGKGSHQFANYAKNILDRRLIRQNDILPGKFEQYLAPNIDPSSIKVEIDRAVHALQSQEAVHHPKRRYVQWISNAKESLKTSDLTGLLSLLSTLILIARDQLKRQLDLELTPLPIETLEERDGSQVKGAAEIFLREQFGIPYYYGIERLCTLATNNVEELLFLSSVLFDGIKEKKILGRTFVLSAKEQERLLRLAGKRKMEFIPRAHTEGRRAQRFLEAVGGFCRSKTFSLNAPYAPGVTGVRLSQAELAELSRAQESSVTWASIALAVLTECIAENLLVARESAATAGRSSGKILYLNRTLCMHFGLPLQMGGWQDVTAREIYDWSEGHYKNPTIGLFKDLT